MTLKSGSPETQSSQSTDTSSVADASTVVSSAPASFSDAFIAQQQGLTVISEADLGGPTDTNQMQPSASSEPGTTDTKTDGTKPADGTTDTSGVKTTDAQDGKSTDNTDSDKSKPTADADTETTDSDTDKAEKHPKGYVPKAAVKEARMQNAQLRDKNTQLSQRIAQLEQDLVMAKTGVTESFDDFKVLSDTEFATLATENPSEALQYTYRLQRFEKQAQNAAAAERLQTETAETLQNIYADTRKAMEEVAPGIFDENSNVMPELRDFAESIGFDEGLFYLTDPSTKIILPGETEPVVLGTQAADIIKLLVNIRSTVNAAKQTAQVDRETLTAEIEQSILAKIKPTSGGFKPISALPSDTALPDQANLGASMVVSEVEFASWPKEKQDRYLAGN